jgi:hypothetical protein
MQERIPMDLSFLSPRPLLGTYPQADCVCSCGQGLNSHLAGLTAAMSSLVKSLRATTL